MSEINVIKSEEVEKQVRFSMSLNRHQRRKLGKRNNIKIPSDKNMNFLDGKLKQKDV